MANTDTSSRRERLAALLDGEPAMPSARRMKLTIGGLIGVLALLYLWHSIFIPIRSGQTGVLWSRFNGGTVTDRVYGEGYRVIFPWDSMTIYDTRFQELHEDVQVLTMDRLDLTVSVTTRFRPRPEELAVLHKKIGPRYRETVVRPDVLDAVRRVVRQYRPEEIRILGEGKLSDDVNQAASAAVAGYPIDLDKVLITRIRIPDAVQEAIQAKLAEEQKLLQYEYIVKQAEKQKERRIIEADGIQEFETRSRISILKWRGIEATESLAHSPNSKIIVMGTGDDKLPILLQEK
jgi:regulator of protease activity HflC (stomatin/prohibitin superfamily)